MKRHMLFLLNLVMSIVLLCGCSQTDSHFLSSESENEDSFEDIIREIKTNDLRSNLQIFPDTLINCVDYTYIFDRADGLFDGSYLVYLDCQYDAEEYEAEVSRIKNLTIQFENGEKKEPIFAETAFNYPAYITIFDNNGTYEYALLVEEDNQIIYIYNQLYDFGDTQVPNDYWPVNYIITDFYKDEAQNGYNMYYYYEEGIGYRLE